MRHKLITVFRLAAAHARAASTSSPATASASPNYFPGLSRKAPGGVGGGGARAARAAVSHHHAGSPLAGLGGRRHSLTEADALAARRAAGPSSPPPSPSRQPVAPGVYVVEGGPAVATADVWPARASVADPDYVAPPL